MIARTVPWGVIEDLFSGEGHKVLRIYIKKGNTYTLDGPSTIYIFSGRIKTATQTWRDGEYFHTEEKEFSSVEDSYMLIVSPSKTANTPSAG